MTSAEDARDEALQLDELAALEEITRGGLPSHVQARLVADAEGFAPPPGCPVFYARDGRTYPERCQLERGHAIPGQTAQHYHGNIGWFRVDEVLS